jgi:hypothetical protein
VVLWEKRANVPGSSLTEGFGTQRPFIAAGATFKQPCAVFGGIPPEWGGPVLEVVLKGVRFEDGSIEGMGVPDPRR